MGEQGMSAITPVTREYLEAIYNITVEGDPVVGVRLAEKFGVSPPNVAQVLTRMERDGLIRMPGRGRGKAGEGVELTTEGRTQAELMLRQHRLAERFLVDVMGMDWVQAHEEAHNLERGMSEALEDHMVKLLGNPRTCPHGNPIPGQNSNTLDYLREQKAVRLSQAEQGKQMRVLLISEVVEDETALLTYLGSLHVMPGARITVLDHDSQDGTYHVSVIPRNTDGEAGDTISLTKELAAKIWLREA
ncbi:MAG: DtxR family transcriptional regulator, Mn-dependent transcriptional regulator [Chloroflexia bacterium]|nr:DtxR family transcriptional regulator, Mn-dependent transcriptional regulator [Chloroflexia bacterium]